MKTTAISFLSLSLVSASASESRWFVGEGLDSDFVYRSGEKDFWRNARQGNYRQVESAIRNGFKPNANKFEVFKKRHRELFENGQEVLDALDDLYEANQRFVNRYGTTINPISKIVKRVSEMTEQQTKDQDKLNREILLAPARARIIALIAQEVNLPDNSITDR